MQSVITWVTWITTCWLLLCRSMLRTAWECFVWMRMTGKHHGYGTSSHPTDLSKHEFSARLLMQPPDMVPRPQTPKRDFGPPTWWTEKPENESCLSTCRLWLLKCIFLLTNLPFYYISKRGTALSQPKFRPAEFRPRKSLAECQLVRASWRTSTSDSLHCAFADCRLHFSSTLCMLSN